MALMAEQPHLDAGALDQKSHLDAPVAAHSIADTNGTSLNPLGSIAPITNGDHAPQNNAHPTIDALKSSDAPMTDAADPEALNPPSPSATPGLTSAIDPLATASPPHTQTVPPAIEQPTSDARDESAPPAPVDTDVGKEVVKEDELMADASPVDATSQAVKSEDAKDVEMGDATDESFEAGASAVAGQESLAMRPVIEAGTSASNTAGAQPSLKAEPSAVVPLVEPAADLAAGPEADANQLQITGQVRQRDAEDEGEPMAKRSKLSDEPSPQQTSQEFKVPGPIASANTDTPAPLPLNGLSTAATNANPAAAPAPPAPIEAKHYDDGPVTPAQKKFLLDAVRKTRKTKAAAAFLEAVDPVKLNIPTYFQYITKPMDLSTMEEKLKQDQYPSANAVAADVDLIAQNTLTFNGPTHAVTVSGGNMLAYFRKLLQGLPRAGQVPEVKKKPPPPPPKPPVRRESRTVAKSPTTKPEPQSYALDPNGMPQIRRDSSSMNDRPKREIHPPKNREMPYTVRPKKKKTVAEFKFCDSVLQELTKKKYQHLNFPFLHPVDPVALNIPTYFKVVKKPTDLETIGKHLSAGEYNSAKDFYNEVKLMFANCFKFNPPEDSVHQIGKQFESTFEQLWAEKDEWMANHVRSERETSEEEDDDEDEAASEPENDNAMKRMLEIQQQIAALSQEAMKLSSGSATTTAARGKASSPKSGGKKSKPSKGAGVPKPKRANSTVVPPAPAKPLKVRKTKFKKLTLDQKRYVSEGISQLDADHMMKAVQIIRNGVPALRNVQDDELELDIEEIPDPVVYDLYQFVRKLRPKDDQLDEDDDYEEDPYMAKSSKAGNRKKNKPMSAREQESKIAQVQKQMQRFNNGSGSEAQSPEAANQDESSDDEQSESSEEE